MKQLKANKTSLYQLVESRLFAFQEWAVIPKLRDMLFRKAYRNPDYFLEWQTEEGSYTAWFGTCVGKALLTINYYCGSKPEQRKVFEIPMDELNRRGLIEEKEEGKRYVHQKDEPEPGR